MPRQLSHALQWVLPLAAAIYLIAVLATSDLSAAAAGLSAEALTVAVATAAVYGATLYLLAFAWSMTLLRPGPNPADLSAAVKAYAVTSFAKYLPGNVFHFVGRQVAAKRMGLTHIAAGQASAVEVGGHLLVAALLTVALLPFAAADVSWADTLPVPPAYGLPLLVLGLAISIAALYHFARGKWTVPLLPSWRRLCLAALCQLVFFLLYAALGALMALVVFDAPLRLAPHFALACLVAWLVGFVTPGAPGGLGVREACLLLLLAPYGEPPVILAFAGLSRLSLLAGEAVFAVSGLLLFRKMASGRTTSELYRF